MTSDSAQTQARPANKQLTLYAMIVATVTIVFDAFLLSLTAPAVTDGLNADAATINLAASITVLMTAAFSLGGGVLGDIHGRKRILLYGIIGVFAASLLAMITPSAALLVPVRALAGVAAALVAPLALAIISVTFDEKERPKALGTFLAAIGISGGIGAIVIALINQVLGWRATFGFIALLAVLSFLMVRRFVQESYGAKGATVDWPGIGLTAAGLVSLLYGINQLSQARLTSLAVLAPMLIGIALLVALVLYSRRAPHPALQLRLFEDPRFSVGIVLVVILAFVQGGGFFLFSIYLQTLQQASPVQAALTLLPHLLAMFVFAILAGRWVGKFSDQKLIAGGLAIMALGALVTTLGLSPSAGFLAFMIPLVLLGAGYSIANTPRLHVVLSSAPPELAGAASATNNASIRVGTAFGIAAMGALFQSSARSTFISDMLNAGFSTNDIRRAAEVLDAWLKDNTGNIAGEFGITVQQLQALVGEYQKAFTAGVADAFLLAAGVALIGAVLAWFTFRGQRAKQYPQPEARLDEAQFEVP